MSGRGIPLPVPRSTGTDALTHYNARADAPAPARRDGSTREIRRWANANGFQVAPKGSIPSRVRDAYYAEARKP